MMSIYKLPLKTAFLSLIALCMTQPVFAQTYDTSGLAPAAQDMGPQAANTGQAANSLGNAGIQYNTSYKTDQSPQSYYEYDKGQTMTTGNGIAQPDISRNSLIHPFGLQLPMTSTGGLAPIFGGGGGALPPPIFTNPLLQQVITTNLGGTTTAINPSTGQVATRVGNTVINASPNGAGVNFGGGVGATIGPGGMTPGGVLNGLGVFGNSGF